MVLRPCRECGAQVSTEAASCPHCGVPSPTVHPIPPGIEEPTASIPPIVKAGSGNEIEGTEAAGSDAPNAWYYASGNVTHGPMKWEELQGRVRTSRLRAGTFIWGPGFKEWKTIEEYPSLGVEKPHETQTIPQFTRRPASSGRRHLLWFGLTGLVLYLVYVATGQDRIAEDVVGNDETLSEPSERAAQTAFGELKGNANYPDRAAVALQKARDIVDNYPGTPEADSAAAMIPDLERAAAEYAAGEAERREAREREALARKWSYTSDIDPMTSGTTRYARIKSENTINLDFPYQGEQYATLMLRNHPSHGRDVIFSIEQGQLLCTSYSGCRVRIRFDEGAAQTWSAVGPSDHSSTALFIRNFNSFVSHLRRSRVIRIQPEIYEAGAPTFEFQVGGFSPDRFAGN